MNKYAIIVAGGSGERMNAGMPKQFILLNSKPILMHTINAFYQACEIDIIVVLPASNIDKWEELCEAHAFRTPHKVVSGGKERFHSVKNGLKECNNSGLVAVHDGVRPFVDKNLIVNAFRLAEQVKSAIPVIEVNETLRQIENGNSKTVERSSFRLVQTPQVFDLEILTRAYEVEYNQSFTDDASVVEHMGIEIKLIDGDRRNIKITTPSDLIIATAIAPLFNHCN